MAPLLHRVAIKTKARFSRLLWHPAWKRTGPILVSALHKYVTYLFSYTLTNLLTAPEPTRGARHDGVAEASDGPYTVVVVVVMYTSICIALYHDSSLKRSGMAHVNEGSQFYLPPTRLSTSGMNHTCLYSPATQHHRTLAGNHFPSR